MNIVGVRFPAFQTIAFGTAGFMGPPIIENYLTPYLPTQLTTSQWGRYVTKLGSVIGLSWAAKSFAGTEAGIKVATGGAIYLAASVLNDFLPSITGTQPATSYYPRLAYSRGMGAQPLLGDYGRTMNLTAQAPGRLTPQSRY